MCSTIQNQFRLGILIAVFGMALTCLITNCPRGGKRSESVRKSERGTISECIPCGPENLGVCLGRNICCGKEIGCLTSPIYSTPCQSLKTIKPSCLFGLTASTCGENGYCRTKYLCCTKGRCKIDPACKSTPHIKYKDFNEGSLPGFEPYGQSMPAERNALGSDEAEVNLDEMLRTKPDSPVNGFDYV